MKDILGNELKVGDLVVTTVSNYERLRIGKIIKFTPKACRVAPITAKSDNTGDLKYGHQLMLVGEEDAILYTLKNSK